MGSAHSTALCPAAPCGALLHPCLGEIAKPPYVVTRARAAGLELVRWCRAPLAGTARTRLVRGDVTIRRARALAVGGVRPAPACLRYRHTQSIGMDALNSRVHGNDKHESTEMTCLGTRYRWECPV